MKKRLLAALVSGAMLMGALAGCGSSTAQTSGGDSAGQTASRIITSRSFSKRWHPNTGSMSATAAKKQARIWA